MLQLQQKMNAMILTMFDRNSKVESDARTLVTRVETVEAQTTTNQEIAKVTEAISKSNVGKAPGGVKPISEFKALQTLKSFKGDRKDFREWNGKLINALAQVNTEYRVAIKHPE